MAQGGFPLEGPNGDQRWLVLVTDRAIGHKHLKPAHWTLADLMESLRWRKVDFLRQATGKGIPNISLPKETAIGTLPSMTRLIANNEI